MNLGAVMFDLDGTLLDTLDDIARCVNTCLADMGDPPRTREAVRMMVGDGVEVLCARALARSSPARVAEMIGRMKQYYREQLFVSTRPYPGILDLLDSLRSKSLRLAILSNRPHEVTVPLVEKFFPGPSFEAVLGGREDVPPKPDPHGAFQIAGDLGLRPSQILYVGDSPVDVKTGKAAGMPTLAVTWGFRDEDLLRVESPTWIAHKPEDILCFACTGMD